MKKNRKEKVKRELYIGKYPFSQYIPVIFFISIIAAIGVLLSSVENNVWTIGSAVYLLLAFSYIIIQTTRINSKRIMKLPNSNKKSRKLKRQQENSFVLFKVKCCDLDIGGTANVRSVIRKPKTFSWLFVGNRV